MQLVVIFQCLQFKKCQNIVKFSFTPVVIRLHPMLDYGPDLRGCLCMRTHPFLSPPVAGGGVYTTLPSVLQPNETAEWHVTSSGSDKQDVTSLTIKFKVRSARSRSQGPGGRVTNAVGTIFRKIFVGTRARHI